MFQTNLVNDYSLRDRTKLVMDLAQFRKEWQEACGGGSLLKVEAPVGLILSDIAEKLNFTEQERHIFLGGRLCNEVDCVNETSVSVRKSN